MNSIVLDPHMSYSALKDEFKNDLDLSSHLEISKDDLHKHYKENYAPSTPLSQPSQPSIRQPQHLFKRILLQGLIIILPRISTDELLEFWSLPQEDFERCDPLLHWWYIPHVLSLLYYDHLTYFFFKKGLLLRWKLWNRFFWVGVPVLARKIYSCNRNTVQCTALVSAANSCNFSKYIKLLKFQMTTLNYRVHSKSWVFMEYGFQKRASG